MVATTTADGDLRREDIFACLQYATWEVRA